ncbi:hypothetical protein TNCV_164371 [Trichonephila clavipes]|nr:hypothetical protein TNCV_164371 [Trichonephila clavipes]
MFKCYDRDYRVVMVVNYGRLCIYRVLVRVWIPLNSRSGTNMRIESLGVQSSHFGFIRESELTHGSLVFMVATRVRCAMRLTTSALKNLYIKVDRC